MGVSLFQKWAQFFLNYREYDETVPDASNFSHFLEQIWNMIRYKRIKTLSITLNILEASFLIVIEGVKTLGIILNIYET